MDRSAGYTLQAFLVIFVAFLGVALSCSEDEVAAPGEHTHDASAVVSGQLDRALKTHRAIRELNEPPRLSAEHGSVVLAASKCPHPTVTRERSETHAVFDGAQITGEVFCPFQVGGIFLACVQ